ncbi:MAG TPA: hypothetical protein VI248_05220, partial [Kineosporiaceae bacterium]
GAPGTIGPDGVAGAQPAPGHPAAAPGHSGRAPDHPGPAAEPEPVPDAATLVEALVSRTAQLLGVTDAARAVADQTAGSARAAACAVLVPDGAGWRVSGGHGLRAAERSLVLEASHWLVEALQSADRPILLQSSDLARRPGGVPLASWRHLLVAPVPRTRVFIVLARAGDDEPFGPEDVHALAGPLTRAAPMLRAAMQVRHLARLLAPLRDVPPGP